MKIIVDYSPFKINQTLVYLREVLQIFGIEGELVIETFLKTQYQASICYKIIRKINLADLGFGIFSNHSNYF